MRYNMLSRTASYNANILGIYSIFITWDTTIYTLMYGKVRVASCVNYKNIQKAYDSNLKHHCQSRVMGVNICRNSVLPTTCTMNNLSSNTQ
jgi:acetoacetate decarboxylase